MRYTIRGSCNRANGRLAFVKQYIRGTGDWRENKGHKVDYQGTVQGSLAAGGKSDSTDLCFHYLRRLKSFLPTSLHLHSAWHCPKRFLALRNTENIALCVSKRQLVREHANILREWAFPYLVSPNVNCAMTGAM